MRPTSEFGERLEAAWEEVRGGNTVPIAEVAALLDSLGLSLPGYRLRDITAELAGENGEKEGVSKAEFQELCTRLREGEVTRTFKTSRQHDRNAVAIEGEMGAKHLVLLEEQAAFADWINTHLGRDPDLKSRLPLAQDGEALYQAVDDGLILCKMVNLAAPDTIDERVINKGDIPIFRAHENLTLAINSAKAVGCVVIGLDSHTLNSGQGRRWLVLGLLWQLIKLQLFKRISLGAVPGLVHLLQPGESQASLAKLAPEQLLLRWVNYQLHQAGCERTIKNFSEDIRDSAIYTSLLAQVAPAGSGVSQAALELEDWAERAEEMLQQADKINSRAFVTPKDVVAGHEKLNLAFVANLFNQHPGLEAPEQPLEVAEETR